jgi:hypothetical protein
MRIGGLSWGMRVGGNSIGLASGRVCIRGWEGCQWAGVRPLKSGGRPAGSALLRPCCFRPRDLGVFLTSILAAVCEGVA